MLGPIELLAEYSDFPWYSGHFTATPAYEAYRDLFAQELALLAAEEMDAWGVVLVQIEGPRLKLVPESGKAVEINPLLDIDGQAATWRG